MTSRIKKTIISLLCIPLIIILLGFLWPEAKLIPVKGANKGDWAENSFWYEPWGTSGVHKGIDIFAKKGTDLLATVDGLVIRTGNWPKGGKFIMILGPKWRVHYYAHLNSVEVKKYDLVGAGQKIGEVGNSGNAKGKPPHLHYTIVTVYPRPWAITDETQGARKAYYLDPHIYLTE
uniref:M23ase beta-sheet core domain-containing protein n=1 Tax=OCS116 cluster bacterium TaxID=2030921 RepID=A0A2A4YVD1_9PROT